jgi:hypothetical protein
MQGIPPPHSLPYDATKTGQHRTDEARCLVTHLLYRLAHSRGALHAKRLHAGHTYPAQPVPHQRKR